MSAPVVEWWVMRIVARPQTGVAKERANTRVAGESDNVLRKLWWLPENNAVPTARDWTIINARVETGAYVPLPMGEIAEPMEVFESEAAAHAWAKVEASKHPLAEFKVILNADIDDAPDGAA